MNLNAISSLLQTIIKANKKESNKGFLMYKRLFPSVESIKQQSGIFFADLVATINELKAENNRVNKWAEEEANRIAQVINTHCNSNVTVLFTDWDDTFYNEEFVDLLNESSLKSSEILLDGAVDVNTGKLKGVFSKLKVKIFTSYDTLSNKYTTEEAASVILHEVGHMVTIFDIMSRCLAFSNYALKDLADKYNDNITVNERRTIIVDIKDRLKSKNIDVNARSKVKDKTTLTLLLLNDFREDLISELGCDPYDITSIEFLADQYASKQGAGRHLITADEKFLKRRYNGYGNQPLFYLMEIMKVSLGILAITLNPFVGGLYFLFWITNAIPGEMTLRYNNTEDRLKRIRLQLVARLNDKTIPKEFRDQALADIKYVDEVVKITEDKIPLMRSILNVIIPSLRQRVKSEKLQMQLEKLALNDLYVKAYELNQIA